MSGRRCKKLKKEFLDKCGRMPAKSHVGMDKDWSQDKDTGKLMNAFWFMGRVVGLKRAVTLAPSEWRAPLSARGCGGRHD